MLFILVIINHCLGLIAANLNGWVVWLSICLKHRSKSDADRILGNIRQAKAYPVICVTIFHMLVMMRVMYYLLAADGREVGAPDQYQRFVIALECEILAIFGNLFIKQVFLLLRLCFRFEKSDHSLFVLYNRISSSEIISTDVIHDHSDADSDRDMLWKLVSMSRICDTSAVPMFIYSYFVMVDFHGPEASIAYKIIAGWLLPVSTIQTAIGILMAFKETHLINALAAFSFLFLPLAIIASTFGYSFTQSVRKQVYQGPIWLIFFLQLTNWVWLLVFWQHKNISHEEHNHFNPKRIVRDRTWEDMKREHGKEIEAWVNDFYQYVMLNPKEFEYRFENNW